MIKKKLVILILCFINFFLCAVARCIIWLLPLSRFSAYFGYYYDQLRMSTLLSKRQKNRASLIGYTVRLVAKYTPWNSNCLTQAMVAAFWCKCLGIPYVFYIGLCRAEGEKPFDFLSHAWIMSGAEALTGGNCLDTHSVINTYSSIGPPYNH